jgi:MCP family monocarboxylic acid transporter-like MFS transporter 10
MMMGDMTDVGRRSGTLFTVLSIGALVGPPISGAIAAATGDFKAVGFYAGKETSISVVIVGWLLRFRL